MQKTIKGKRYNTETAKLLAVWNNNEKNDAYVTEHLHRTNSGNFFLHIQGGSSSIYGNNGEPAEIITVLTEKQAKQWAKEKLNNSEYTAIFDKLSEPKVKITADISQSCKDALEKFKIESGKSNGEVIEELVLRHFL